MLHVALVNRLSLNAARFGTKLAPICVCAIVSALGPIVHAEPSVYLTPQVVVGDQAANVVVLTVKSFTVTPTTVVGGIGGTATGTVTISDVAPAGGQAVTVTVPTADAAIVTTPVIVTVPVGLTSVTFTIATAAVSTPVAVSLTAAIGNSTQEATLTVINPGGNFYASNLQFFSVPYTYNDLLANIFVSEPTSLDIASWNPAKFAYDFQGDPNNVKVFPGIGYWTVFPAAGTFLQYLGTPASSTLGTTVSLSAGWNSIGDPYAVPYNIADMKFTTSNYTFGQATSPTFDLISPTLYSFLQDPTGLSGAYAPAHTGNSLTPGLGYWIYAFAPTTLNFTPPGTPASTFNNGLIHQWKLDGNANDSVGTLNGTIQGPVQFQSGVIGGCMVGNGLTTGITFPVATDMQFQGSFTLSAWAETSTVAPASHLWQSIFFDGDDRSGVDPYYLSVNSSGTLNFQVCSPTASYTVTAGMPQGQFVLVTGTYDQTAGVLTLYLNGAQASSISAPNGTPVVGLNPGSFPGEGLGCNNQFPASNFNFSWNGAIDDMRVYDRALSSAEVQALYQSTIPSSLAATTGTLKRRHH